MYPDLGRSLVDADPRLSVSTPDRREERIGETSLDGARQSFATVWDWDD
jgi:hypothetical protein